MNDLRLQDPGAVLDHPVDWSDWLATGETITAATFAIVPDAEDPAPTLLSLGAHTTTTTTVTVEGLTFGQIYRLEHSIETSAGREDTRSLTIRCGAA